ncbi:hypothetical protein [Caldalkalibacillus mannanilyticus]|uniref:hypothetical protein n=1 Tax=Caldalkalibacillus mannanilyticus TaxID=1418 RepID=UPI00046A514F|nr:hypothetical protein [Caldalkalibacillus mannanilyticus]
MIKKTLLLSFKTILLVGIAIIFINDFFPQYILNQVLSNKLTAILMIAFALIFSLLPISWERKTEKEEIIDSIKSDVLLLLYIVALAVILNLLGGTSQVGITFKNPIVLLILLCAFGENIRKVQKLKKLR